MTSIQNRLLPWVVSFFLLPISFTAAAQETSDQPGSTPVRKTLPHLLDPELRAVLNRGDFATAVTWCTNIISSAPLVTEPGVLAAPYYCLGEALFGQEKYAAAAVAFGNSIEQLGESVGVFDPLLIQPLEGLGKTLLSLNKFDEAEEFLRQAKDLTHRNLGIYNLEQSRIVNRLTRAYFDKGEVSKATREQKFLLRAHEEKYGEAPQLLPALRRMGKWQEHIGRSDLARMTYRRALGIMDRAYGPNDLRRVGPLRDFAQSYMNTPRGSERVMARAGAKALQEVVELYQAQEFTDVADLAKAWGELGDWYVIGGQRRQARAAYREAGNVLRQGNGDNDSVNALFSKPVEIEYEDVPIGVRPSRISTFPNGIANIEFEFTVTSTGRVANVVVTKDDLNYPRFAVEVAQRVKASRYRPRIVDGEPVDTHGVVKVFQYDFTRLDKTDASDVPESKGTDEDGASSAEDEVSEDSGKADDETDQAESSVPDSQSQVEATQSDTQ